VTRVLLAEDDEAIHEPLARALKREGYEVEVVTDGVSALTAALKNPDLLILDIGLPQLDGLEVCRRLRAEDSTVPVLILTARADEMDIVVGLDAGADDYVTKPFRLAVLMARARALLRRLAPEETEQAAALVRLDGPARRAFVGDRELQLTVKEFNLLEVLLRERDKVVSREALMEEIWPDTWVGSQKTLDMHISTLRRKLAEVVDYPFIVTVRGVGFRFDPSYSTD
jgi:DNA-binding response OmpR family regulator